VEEQYTLFDICLGSPSVVAPQPAESPAERRPRPKPAKPSGSPRGMRPSPASGTALSPTGAQAFVYEGNEVRCFGTDRAPWFVASDVCRALGIPWRSDTLDRIKPEWRGLRKIRTLRRNPDGAISFRFQDVVVINEKAIYKLAFSSRRPEAEAFTDWVAGEVLPAIRETGGYTPARQRHYQALGKSPEWIEERQEGIVERKALAATLHAHEANNFADCTNAIYYPVLGGTAAAVKARLQITPKANLRDNLGTHDLFRVKFAEILATEKIEGEDLQGNSPCRAACKLAGDAVAQARLTVQRTRIGPPSDHA
jgi:prophage antirepressor-like protein